MASASASVIYVDLSSDSEDEQTPPNAKRRRIEQLQQKDGAAAIGQALKKCFSTKVVNIPNPSLPGGGTLPSGLTVTKHITNNNKIPCNGNNISMSLPGGGISGGTTKTITTNINNGNKPIKSACSQTIAWSMTNKAPSLNVMLPSIPRHQVKVTPILKALGKPNLSTTTPPQVKLTPRPMSAVQLQKTLIVNKLPTLQNSPMATLQQHPQPPLSAQYFPKQQSLAPGPNRPQPPTGCNLKQSPNLASPKTATKLRAGHTHTLGNTVSFTAKLQPSLTTATPVNANVLCTAARTLPFRSTSVVQPTTAPLISSMAASATPPLRLLATPPHTAAALNEPLLLNLPPTTSITPQLTPTTTPPPHSTISTMQQQLAKGSTFKLSSMPVASISPVCVTVTKAKRIQPITVLKKSDDEWRKHVAEQQQHQLKVKPSKEQPSATPTIVLVESPPTTPPTEKPETERARNCAAATEKSDSNILKAKSNNSNLVKSDSKKEQKANSLVKTNEFSASLVEKELIKPELRKEKLSRGEEEDPPPATNVMTSPPPLMPEYAALLKLSREVDKSEDMERLVDVKLMKYYYSVHENFVKSRGFRKMVELAIDKIKNDPEMIYVHLKGVIDELKVRRKGRIITTEVEKQAETTIEGHTSSLSSVSAETLSGDKRLDERIRKLSRTLYTITKRIAALEEADVDWNDDDDSSYLQVERFKKRACQIYEKICDLTGESKSAHRQLKQPFIFKDSPYPQFNRTLSSFVNRMQEFPDYYDVLRLLEHCNQAKDLGLANFEMKRIAHDAFVKVGRLLQARRKTDLYETVTHFTANAKDPAAADPELLAKLNENHKKQTKISDVLARYAREQDLTAEEHREARLKEKLAKAAQVAALLESTTVTHEDDDDKPCTSAQAKAKAKAKAMSNNPQKDRMLDGSLSQAANEDEDEDSTSEDSEEEEDVDAFVDNFKTNGEVSDAESEKEENSISEPKTIADVIDDKPTKVKTAASLTDESESMPNGKLKIMSVSSLNASLHQKSKDGSGKKLNENLKQISAEIIISDEES